MKHTGGNWDPKELNVYFIASSLDMLERSGDAHDHLLAAVNEIKSQKDMDRIERWCDEGRRVFIDSGVFNLANSHAKAHNIPMDVALSLAPDEIDGFDRLFDAYCNLITRLGDRVWGYIEVDQGGRENKIKTRAKLEGMGFKPIPVYHPFNDGWDYFDTLGQNYDRICFGNVVQANRPTRLRLLATAWERRRKYPNLWIHMLGMTPNEWLHGFPVNSCDSSSWLTLLRWTASARTWVALKSFGSIDPNFAYQLGADPQGPKGHIRATQPASYEARFVQENWRATGAEYDALGCERGLFHPPAGATP